MTSGEGVQNNIQYKGKHENFVVILKDGDDVKALWDTWKKQNKPKSDGEEEVKDDDIVPIADFVEDEDNIWISHLYGSNNAQGKASKAVLSTEFGTEKVSEAMHKLLLDTKSVCKTVKVAGRTGATNESMDSNRTK